MLPPRPKEKMFRQSDFTMKKIISSISVRSSAATLIIALASIGAQAQTIYKREVNGVMVYSNSPANNAVAVKLPELSVVSGQAAETPIRGNFPTSIPSLMPNPSSLLPPPPPSLGIKTPAVSAAANAAEIAKKEASKVELKKAEAELKEQSDIRLGSEKNYQRKLDRLKPYEEKVEELKKKS